MNVNNIRNKSYYMAKMGIFPASLYFVAFCILTYPILLQFSTHYFTDGLDGLDGIWIIWWVDKSITELHQLPWYTTYIFYPHGTTLVGHAVSVFNGLMAIPLIRFMTLVEVHNFIVIFSFVASGLSAFFLAYYFSKSYWASILAGYIFTFSNYHFAHAAGGHLQYVTLEWIPLFVLFWHLVIVKPSIRFGVASSITLFLVILCSPYYAFYCILVGLIFFIWHAFGKKDPLFFLKKAHLVPSLVFIIVSMFTTGLLIWAMLLSHIKSSFIGGHDPSYNSLDLLGPFIYGYYWRFSSLTEPYWSKLYTTFYENSVHLGISVVLILIYVWIRRKRFRSQSIGLWYFILVFFTVMSLGPILHVCGKEIPYTILPYKLLGVIFPPLRLGGVPVRMMAIAILAASVICAVGFESFSKKVLKKRLYTLVFIAFLIFEYLPSSLPTIKPPIPNYIYALKDLPDNGGIVNLVDSGRIGFYYQTIHEKPITFGHIALVPTDVKEKYDKLKDVIQSGKFSSLYNDYGIRYLITPSNINPDTSSDRLFMKTVYHDSTCKIYDLKPSK